VIEAILYLSIRIASGVGSLIPLGIFIPRGPLGIFIPKGAGFIELYLIRRY
jgi:hypothetical protein